VVDGPGEQETEARAQTKADPAGEEQASAGEPKAPVEARATARPSPAGPRAKAKPAGEEIQSAYDLSRASSRSSE
jgi:hypothetical protein